MSFFNIEIIFEPTGDAIVIEDYESTAENEAELIREVLHYTTVNTIKLDD